MKSVLASDSQKLIEPLRSQLTQLLQELVQTNSVSVLAGGNETPAQLVLQTFFREQGIQAELYDTAFILESDFAHVRRKKPYAGRKNLSVRLEGSGRGRSLLLNGHIDTVPAGHGAWSRSPWSGQLQDGRVHGLG